jgi:putative Holliday junction resolvase
MRLLGIDYGEAKIGIARSDGVLAEPVKVIQTQNWKGYLRGFCNNYVIEKIIVGIPRGKIAQKTKEFIEELRHELKIPVEPWDETGTTNEANQKLIEGGNRRTKRKKVEDAIAAAIILQSYIDSHS